MADWPQYRTEETSNLKDPVWDNLQIFGVTVPPWLFWTTIGLILGATTLETLEAWGTYAAEPFLRQLWLAASADKFQTPLHLAAIYVPIGLGIQKVKEQVIMRFLNREATIERAKELGRTEGLAEGRSEGLVAGRAERDQAWEGWIKRREAAAEQNEPFNEPPPSQVRD